MDAESLCGAPTVAGGACRRKPSAGGRCGQHAAADVSGVDGHEFRAIVLDTWELTAVELRILDAVCACLDAIVALDGQVAADGLMVDGSKGQRVLHPAVAEARQQRLALSRFLAQLELPDPEAIGNVEPIRTPEAVRARRAAQARWRRAEKRGA